jgi:hypothetical protein
MWREIAANAEHSGNTERKMRADANATQCEAELIRVNEILIKLDGG